ncbi:hypothetical protein [Janibacter alittae]|uniref:Uncharacterized protein n=1 Tax=Janibacter alittae TaxID=3115209 RepID=A0ABZ2MLG9_9MICO
MSAVPRPPAGMTTDQARIARTLRMVARMANGTQASLVARGEDLAAFHHEIARAERQPFRAVVVIDQAVDLRRALQSDHADAGEILRALHSVPSQRLQDAQLVLAMTSAISTSATVHFAVNAASSSLVARSPDALSPSSTPLPQEPLQSSPGGSSAQESGRHIDSLTI